MPNRTKENYVVLIGALKDTTYYNFHLESQAKALLTLVELQVYSNPPSGFIFIISMKGVCIQESKSLHVYFAFFDETMTHLS